MITKYSKFLESKKFPNIRKLIVDEYVVLIGRDSLSNDHLTTVMANGEDIWFHVKGHPGAHVVVDVKNTLLTPETLDKICDIVVKNSKVGDVKSVEVVWCKAKFVKKLPGMKPGQVNVDYKNSNFKEVYL